MIGVSFQPGSQDQYGNGNGNQPAPGNGVQEAIKVLSLRLPKVVGAQGISPQGLLGGSGGGSRVDSIVNQVLAKMFPGAGMPQMQPQSFGMAPPMPMGAPNLSGSMGPNPLMQMQREAPSIDTNQFLKPRVVADLPPQSPPEAPFTGGPPRYPNMPTPDGGFTPFPGMIDQLPKRSPFPEFPSYPSAPYEPEPLI